MVEHHPGAYVHKITTSDPTNLPWALTAHLLSLSIPQFKRTTTAPFLERAAHGTLPKQVIAEWLANDRLYIQGYISLAENLIRTIEATSTATRATATSVDIDSIESRLLRWLVAAIENVQREAAWFDEMTTVYGLTAPTPTSAQKSPGVQRFEALFSHLSTQPPNPFLPWLEGAVCLFSTEKVYYEAWRWARKQDRRRSSQDDSSPAAADYSGDLDGGAMRKEFIPNWSNKNFLMFVETLERIINEGVGAAVGRDDERWKEVKRRAELVWQATLDAEEVFWPPVEGVSSASRGDSGVKTEYNGTAVHGLLGAKEGSLLEPSTRRYDGGSSDGQETVYVPHVGHVGRV
jgi:thiaminase